MEYKVTHMSVDNLGSENHGRIDVEVKTDTLGFATISFGSSFTLRLNEFNVDELRSLLYDASRQLGIDRAKTS